MSRGPGVARPVYMSAPRVSGDEPSVSTCCAMNVECSPRERG